MFDYGKIPDPIFNSTTQAILKTKPAWVLISPRVAPNEEGDPEGMIRLLWPDSDGDEAWTYEYHIRGLDPGDKAEDAEFVIALLENMAQQLREKHNLL